MLSLENISVIELGFFISFKSSFGMKSFRCRREKSGEQWEGREKRERGGRELRSGKKREREIGRVRERLNNREKVMSISFHLLPRVFT